MAADRPLTGLVVVIPEAEPVVGPRRLRLDESAPLGAPAHVTVLFPFVPPGDVDQRVRQRVAAVVRSVPTFDYTFSRTDWFGDTVVWLAPDEPGPFQELTARIAAAFPEHPPFEGQFPDAVPHLTVGHRHPRPLLAAAERAVASQLPVRGRAGEVVLLAQTEPGGHWSRRASFPLGR